MKNLRDRELSWLSFNYRVLQEAKDPANPLYERIKFLAIWSSNLDEFFRVRVASLRSLLSLKKKSQKELKFNPAELLKQIHQEVERQQEEFGYIFSRQIKKELYKNKIHLLKEDELNTAQQKYVIEYYDEYIAKYIQPFLLVKKKIIPFLQNNRLYFALKLAPKNKDGNKRIKHTYAMIEIPDNRTSRFVKLPSQNNKHCVIFIDDILRYNLPCIFKEFEIVEVISVKLTRDAELYIEDEFEGNLLEKIQKSIHKRDTGIPSRFLFDGTISKEFRNYLKDALNLTKEDMVPGGRYHNYNDFFSFPLPENGSTAKLSYLPMPPQRSEEFDVTGNKFDLIKEKDRALFFPYQSYDHVIELLEQAANDENVTAIKITQYRVAKESAVIKSLIKAKKNGKDVMVFVEVKARFDEERNIIWAREMENAGIKVYYSFPGLKVHAKIALITRTEDGREQQYSYLSTGNFNENTAKQYSDFGLFTADKRITSEVEKVFSFLAGHKIDGEFKHLLVAQFNIREGFSQLIDNEIQNYTEGKEAYITAKLNSIEDPRIIKSLYKASRAGVNIDLVTRGICCLIPGIKNISSNIHCISILDRFLEHARFFVFHNSGDEKVYAGSADWMKRNLSRRIEVVFPIYDNEIKKKIKDILLLQLNDNVKARLIDEHDRNKYRLGDNPEKIRSQYATYEYIKNGCLPELKSH